MSLNTILEKIYYKSEVSFLRNIIADLPGIIFWKDINSVYQGCNNVLASVFGVKNCDDIIGKTDFDFTWTAEEATRVVNDDLDIIKSGIAKQNIYERVPLADGTYMDVLTNKVPLYDEKNEIIGILAVATDITKQKEAEKQLLEAKKRAEIDKEKAEAANYAKEAFLKNMRHDLRTPFSGMFSLADSLASREADPQKKSELAMIAESAQLLLDYMNKVLEQASRGEKTDAIFLAPLNLNKLIHDVVTMMKPQLALKPVQIRVNYPAEVPHEIVSDATYLERIMMNLLGNAAKFTDEGQINISVKIIKREGNHLTLAIAVADTGIGIPVDKREIIFDKFTRLDAAYKGCYPGMGLGLYDVKYLCNQLGGDISVESNGKRGSVFTCTLHCTDTGQTHNDVSTTNAVTNIYTLPALKILVVEDHPVAIVVAKTLLGGEGHAIDIAKSGREALEKFNTNKYDLLLLDNGLPDIEGTEVAKQIRQQEIMTNQPHTPIVALTGHGENHEGDLSIFDRVLQKPLSVSMFNQQLADFFRK
jgi:two-component system aerobic respiration control sensor histidine kinase ArcB